MIADPVRTTPTRIDADRAAGSPASPDQTRLVDVRLVGQYALQPIWGDGHATGYYAFRLLRERCPCPDDVAALAAAEAAEPPRPSLPHRPEEHAR